MRGRIRVSTSLSLVLVLVMGQMFPAFARQSARLPKTNYPLASPTRAITPARPARAPETPAMARIHAAIPLLKSKAPGNRQSAISESGQSVTILPDGRWLLVGGEDANGPVATAAIKNPQTNEITPITPTLNAARAWHTATLLPDGTVLILGGIGTDGQVVRTVELVDPDTQTFQTLPAAGVIARAHHTATVMTDGRVLIAGGLSDTGNVVNTADLWDSQTRTAVRSQAKMKTARYGHTATLLADGSVLFAGGADKHGRAAQSAEVYTADGAGRFVKAGATQVEPQSAVEALLLAASLPQDGAADVVPDARIALRFSKRLRVDSVSNITVTLTGPEGGVESRVVPVEGGRLAFVTPKGTLTAGATYTLAISGAVDAEGAATASASISFTVASTAPLPVDGPDNEQWVPGQDGNWQSGRPDSRWRSLAALQAEAGVTAVAGQALTLDGKPLANVTMKVDDRSTLTDETGRFLLKHVAPGRHVLVIDGKTASRHHKTYGLFEAAIQVAEGKTNALDFTIWMPVIDKAHEVTIPSPTTSEVVVTTPYIPGLEVHIPPNTVIRDKDGQPVTKLSITAIPLDRPPFPLPAYVYVPIYFTVQPGGSEVEVGGYGTVKGARVIYPNYRHEVAGKRMEFWHYDPEDKGWYVYGGGNVSADGRQIVPDPDISIYEFTGAMVSLPSNAPGTGPVPGSAEDGDPVDLGTGLFILSGTDLSLPDIIPISMTRTYRPQDGRSRAFGIGTTDSYEMFLVGDINPYTYIDLILPDGGRIHYPRTSSGTGFQDAVYRHTSSPSAFYGSTIVYNATNGGWKLTTNDGAQLTFGDAPASSNPSRGALTGITDRYGNHVTLIRDGNFSLTKIISPNGRWISLTPDSAGRVTQITDNIGRTVSYAYDASGRLSQVTNVGGGVTQYTYDTSSRMLTIQDARGTVYLTNEYDTNGRVTKQTQADGTFFQFAYTLDSNGKVTQTDVTDPRGHVRRMTFNAGGYPLGETYALGESEQQAYTFEWQTGTNFFLSLTDALGRHTSFTYDSAGNVTGMTRLAGTSEAVTTSFTYDPVFNQTTSVTDPLNHTTAFAYDSHGSLTSVTDPLGDQATYAYNSAGQVISMTNEEGKTWTVGYSGADPIRLTNPLGNSMTRFVDTAGRVTRVNNAMGQGVNVDYDALNRVTQVTDPLQGTTSLSYDANSNLLSLTDPRSHVISYAYNNLDQTTTRTDALQHDDSYLYDEVGNLRQFTDRKGQVTAYTYDALGRLTLVTFADSSTIGYSYDAGNRLTQVVDSASGTITYGYDNRDHLTSETSSRGTVSYTYDLAGRLTTMTAGNQAAVTYTYDNANRLTQIQQGSATATMSYDHAGRMTSQTQPNGVTSQYTYDDASHLTGITYQKGVTVLGNLTYSYDKAGRVRGIGGSFARTGLPLAMTSASYNNANQQTGFNGQTQTYDLNGNLTGDGANTYGWNARDQLISISGPGLSASFQYDAAGRRVSKTINGATTALLYSGGNVVQEQTGGTPSANILTGGGDTFFSRSDANGTSSPVVDGLGSPIALTDNSGAVQTSYTYEPFGNTTASGTASSNPSQFTGRENDNTGLYYYRARYYSPTLQRFISEDPIGQAGGLNIYAYAANNPVNFTDPSGLTPFGDFAWGAADAVDPFGSYPQTPHTGPGAVIDGHMMPDMFDLFGPPNRNSTCYKLGFATGTGLLIAAAVAEPILGFEEEIAGEASAAANEAEGEAASGSKTNCFVAGTLVLTAAGEKPIEQVAAGERVISTDPERSVTASQAVRRTFVSTTNEVVDVHVAGVTITATVKHPFWVEGQGWTAAGELKKGSRLHTKDGGVVEVESVTRRRGEFAVYNLEVTSIHSYYVSPLAILVHNDSGSGSGRGRPPGPTVDPNTGEPVGRFINDAGGNTMIEPEGGTTRPAGPGGGDTHTTYPNGSNYQRYNPGGHANNPTPHGHGHMPGTGPGMKGQGPSIDVNGKKVPWNSPDAHWPLN